MSSAKVASKVSRTAVPKKSNVASSSSVVAPVVAPSQPVAETPRKVSKKVVPAQAPVVQSTVVEPVVEADAAVPSKKQLATSEDVVSVLVSAIQKLKEEAQNAKSRKDKDSVATLNELAKNLNSLKKPIDKLARSKPPRKQINIDKSRNGFLKPLEISDDLAKFMGCEPGTKKSRVEVTRSICQYIEENKLQFPENRREIRVDPTLQKLLNYDPAVATEPLTYYSIQTCIQPHFIKPTVVA